MVEDYVQVSASLLGLAQEYMDLQSLSATDLRSELASFARLERVPISTWWGILDRMAALDPEPGFGLKMGLMTRPHHVGVLGYLAMSCATLEQALDCFQRFQPLLQNLTPLALSLEPDGLRLTWDKTYGRSTQHSTDVMVAITLAFVRVFTEQPELIFSEVTFPGLVPQHHQEAYRRLLNCPVTFGAGSLSLLVAKSVLALPITTHDPYMQNLMEQQARTLLNVLPHPDTWMVRIKQSITEALENGEPGKHHICERMGLPPGFIDRCLKRRNLTFKAVVNQIQRQRSLDYLADPGLQLSEVAYRLGYSEQSAFTRAFRSWYGLTPLRYRRERLGGGDVQSLHPAPVIPTAL